MSAIERVTTKRILLIALLVLVNAGLLLVLSGFAALREDPMFWRSAGGWPEELRALVKLGFYPMFILEAAVLLCFSWQTLSLATAGPLRRRLYGISFALWVWMALVVALVTNNNTENLIAGRSLHWHPYGAAAIALSECPQ